MVILAVEIKQLRNGKYDISYSIIPGNENSEELGIANMLCDVTQVVMSDEGKSYAVQEILKRAAEYRVAGSGLIM